MPVKNKRQKQTTMDKDRSEVPWLPILFKTLSTAQPGSHHHPGAERAPSILNVELLIREQAAGQLPFFFHFFFQIPRPAMSTVACAGRENTTRRSQSTFSKYLLLPPVSGLSGAISYE